MLIGTRINVCLQLLLPGGFYTSAAIGKRLQSVTGKGVEAANQLQVRRHVPPQKNIMRGKISQDCKISYKYATLPIENQHVGFSF